MISKQLLQDLENIVAREVIGTRLCAMLSGGIDSLAITHIAKKYTDNILDLTVTDGIHGEDLKSAIECAKELNIEIHSIVLSAEQAYNLTREYLQQIPSQTIVRLQCGLVAYVCAKFAKENNYNALMCGDGADALFGSTGHMRRKSKRPEFTQIKRETCIKGITNGVGKDFLDICKLFELKSIVPYRDQNFVDKYVILEDNIVNKPKEKQILRNAFSNDLSDIRNRERLTLQDGVGFKNDHIALLRANSKKGYKSPKYLIKEILDDIRESQRTVTVMSEV
jgi:asparagine synthetase B (glutamine-hydrolysing)